MVTLIVRYARYIDITITDANRFSDRIEPVILDNNITADTKSNDIDKYTVGCFSRFRDR